MLRYVLFALVVYKSVEAYIGIIPEEEKPAKFADQEGCYFSKFDRVLPVGVPYTPIDGSTCVKYTCQESKIITEEGCGAKRISTNCEHGPADYTKPFPDCCEKVRCTLPDGRIVEA
ncbi:uncharacterized protein LOC112050466 [Bicyclus anynana]|uniref:Uncharacterized protein LOC112050466 n=1 Tax=Bicyclus anynana TaxID=110368 RepID=A0A6J1NMX0_BICAN|nr:uncharacterized protein LOC112050466 [Bicyclus anynana]